MGDRRIRLKLTNERSGRRIISKILKKNIMKRTVCVEGQEPMEKPKRHHVKVPFKMSFLFRCKRVWINLSSNKTENH